MSERTVGIALMLLLAVLSLAFQMKLKSLADAVTGALAAGTGAPERVWALARIVLSPRGVLAVGLAGAALVVYFEALRRLDLNLALALAALSMVANAVAAGWMLGEPMSAMRIAGILVVGAGLLLVVTG